LEVQKRIENGLMAEKLFDLESLAAARWSTAGLSPAGREREMRPPLPINVIEVEGRNIRSAGLQSLLQPPPPRAL